MRRLMILILLVAALPSSAQDRRASFNKATGRLIESQSDASETTLRQNAIAGGIPDSNVEVRMITTAELKALVEADNAKIVKPVDPDVAVLLSRITSLEADVATLKMQVLALGAK